MSSPDEVSAPEVCADKDAASTGDMNSGDQVSAPESDLGQEGREHIGGPLISPRVPGGSNLIQPPLEIGEGEGGQPGMESCELESGQKLEVTEEGEGVLRDPEGQTSSPVHQEEVSLDFLPQLSIEAMAMMRELTNLQTRKVCRYQSPQTCAAELAALWGHMDEGSNRGPLSLSSVEGKQTSTGLQNPRGQGRGRAWVTPRRGATSRIVSSEAVQCPSYNPTSSDESNETRVMRVTICLKEGGQAKSTGITEREDTGKHTNVHGRGSFVHVPPSVLSNANRTFNSGVEKQALGELEGSLSKKKPSVGWGTEGNRHNCPGATSAATAAGAAASAAVPAPTPAASGGFPKTSPRKKAPQEKKPLTDASRASLGGTFPPWGQRLKSAPVRSATLPPISGVALLGKASKRSLISGPKECKPFCTGKRPMARKTKESQPGAKEDNDPTRDPGLQAQLPTQKAEQPCTCTHRGEMSSGDPNTRAPQVAGNSQFLSLSQRSARPRAAAPAGDQDTPVGLLLPLEGSEPLLQGTPGCPQCLMLRKEIEELKEQLAIMQALNEKFQDL
ncbi:uncharacterized protein CXorf49 homolog [Onychomys torridus]|uniref:uncharacterized protein CXorf49 homolog n=1 Tax=Onychomys torridus TaxID=38674 RepID=UPI00167FD16D|nr:uncharacterized protein CXorf49 homolog [Onychomys torridus]